MLPVHANQYKGSVARYVRDIPQRTVQKRGELLTEHLARGHREFGMLNPALAPDLADREVVWRIRKGQVGQFACHQTAYRAFIAGVAAQQPMASKLVKVAQPGNRRLRNSHLLVVRAGGLLFLGIAQDQIDLAGLKAGEFRREANLRQHHGEVAKLERQRRPIPAGALGQLVVGEHECALLGGRHVRNADGRHLLQPK